MRKILNTIGIVLLLYPIKINAEVLPSNILNVVPKYAIQKKSYPEYTTEGDTFRGLFIPGDASIGSYSAGIALGLLEKNTYNYIIGTSSGALATVFLYADSLKEYTEFTKGLDTKNVLSEKIKFLSLLFGDSFYDNKPLEDYLKKNITNSIIDKMAAQQKKGFRGFIATSNIDTQQGILWDLGAIANNKNISYEEKRDILTKAVLASTALPGIFPPSSFNVEYKNKKYTQTHVDGGLGLNFALKKWLLPINFDDMKIKEFYIVQTKEFIQNYPPIKKKIVNLLLGSLSSAYTEIYKSCKRQVKEFGNYNNIDTYVNIIPKNAPLNFSPLDFSKKRITETFEAGLKSVHQNKLKWKTLSINIDE